MGVAMRKLLDVLELVPAWVYAAAVVALAALVLVTELGRQRALTQAAQARAELAEVRRDHATALAKAIQRARTAEAKLAVDLMREANELQSRLADRDQRVFDLADRLHQHARPVRLCAAAPGGAPAAAGGGGGQRDTGLRELDGPDLVVLDVEARSQLAEFAVSARDTGETLKTCRALLRSAWRSP